MNMLEVCLELMKELTNITTIHYEMLIYTNKRGLIYARPEDHILLHYENFTDCTAQLVSHLKQAKVSTATPQP